MTTAPSLYEEARRKAMAIIAARDHGRASSLEAHRSAFWGICPLCTFKKFDDSAGRPGGR